MVQVLCWYVIQILKYDEIFTPYSMEIYHIEYIYGATLSMEIIWKITIPSF